MLDGNRSNKKKIKKKLLGYFYLRPFFSYKNANINPRENVLLKKTRTLIPANIYPFTVFNFANTVNPFMSATV